MSEATPPTGRPEVALPSPMSAVNESSAQYRTVDPPAPVWVWVEEFPADAPCPGEWFRGELAEWTLYESAGWTGWVRFSMAPAERYSGRFAVEAMQPLGGSAQ